MTLGRGTQSHAPLFPCCPLARRVEVPSRRGSGAAQWYGTHRTPWTDCLALGSTPLAHILTGRGFQPQKTGEDRATAAASSRGKATARTLRGAPPRPLADSGNTQRPCQGQAFQPSPWTHVCRPGDQPPAEVSVHKLTVKPPRETTLSRSPKADHGSQVSKHNGGARTDTSNRNSKYLQKYRRESGR